MAVAIIQAEVFCATSIETVRSPGIGGAALTCSDLPGHEASPISGGIFCGEHCPSGDPPVHARFVEFPLARWIDHSISSEPFAGTDRSPVRHWIVFTPPGNVSKITIGTYSDELTKILHNVPLPIADGPSVGVLPLPRSADSAKVAAKASIP